MSVTNPLFLQKTALDIQATYQNASLQTPISLSVGTGLNNLMDIDTPSIVEYEKTVTGDTSVALMPVKITGKLYLHPQSPALFAIQKVISGYYLNQIIVPGTISVSSKAGGWSYVFNNVVFSTPFGGYSVDKVIADYQYTFEADIPNVTNVTNLLNSTAGLVNLV